VFIAGAPSAITLHPRGGLVPASALALALAAAVVHAMWNLLVARARDPQAATAVAGVLGAIVLAPFAVATWHVESEALPFAAASALIHVGYFSMLALAYTRADLSVVYPLARGSAPVLVLVGAVLVLGESPSWLQSVGVVMVAVGVISVRGLRPEGDRAGEVLGLCVGVTIAAYTVVDKQGVDHANALPYLLLLNAPASIVYLLWVVRRRGREVLGEVSPLTVLTGTGMMGAYALTLGALQLGPASGVAATRETSILFATLFGAILLRERVGTARALGAATIVAGVAAVALG
jgi:drug/metabolite transporter (DMT)-like permease